jgi:TRAP-type C4-dicarboxylate transport system permease small subunit
MRMFDRVVAWLATLGLALAASTLLTSLALIVYSVGMRYFLNKPEAWVDEAVGYLLVASVMLAAAAALRDGEHICVDIVTEKLSSRGRRVIVFAGLIAVAVTAALLVFEGYGTVEFSRMVGLRSNGYLALPLWIPQLLIPIGAALLGLAAIAALVTPGARPPAADLETKLTSGID